MDCQILCVVFMPTCGFIMCKKSLPFVNGDTTMPLFAIRNTKTSEFLMSSRTRDYRLQAQAYIARGELACLARMAHEEFHTSGGIVSPESATH